jgi:hypothetical protein
MLVTHASTLAGIAIGMAAAFRDDAVDVHGAVRGQT